jgi:putative ABC transport system ATP-binding protein
VHRPHLVKHLSTLKLTKTYLALSFLYGISTLIVPFATQLLVNDLALTGLWLNTFTFLVLIGIALAAALIIKYFQLLIVEYLQRHLFFREVSAWERKVPHEDQKSPYFLEVFSLLKSFSAIVTDGADLFLKCFFGAIALAFIHPGFLVISALFLGTIALIRWQGRGAILASLEESDRKYEIYDELQEADNQGALRLMGAYLKDRETQFGFIKRQSQTVFGSYFVLQMLLLAWGIQLVQVNQLSIGQLVSAEIIISGIFVNFSLLPKILRSFYEFETSYTKLELLKTVGEE